MKRFLLSFFAASSLLLQAQVPAFPGAEGHGRYTTGGRGGSVYIVTSLADASTVGTLRHAINQSGTRTIVFAVSGTIHLASELRISNGNLTIAGQTAPGDGICLAGFPVSINANNVILRYIRCRMGDLANTNADGADAMGGRGYSDIIIDHCSMSWSSDECVSFYGNTNFTLQWNLISESLRLSGHSKGPHGYGGIWGGNNASFHHNLMASHDSRNPRLGPYAPLNGKECVDLRNNVIYNWSGNSCYGGEAMNANIVNCFYKPGPATPSGAKRGRIISIDKKTGLPITDSFYSINDVWGKFYIEGNVVDDGTNNSDCLNATNDNWTYGVYNQFASGYTINGGIKDSLRVTTPFEAGMVTTHTAVKAFDKVLDYAGCSSKRDSLDVRIVEETRTGTTHFKGLSKYNGLGEVTYPAGTVIGSTTLTAPTTINWKSTSYPKNGIIDSQQDLMPTGATSETWSAWPLLATTAPPIDEDKDGMPDAWETDNGLSPSNAADRNSHTLSADYTNLEVYLNSLVETNTVNQNLDAIGTALGKATTGDPQVRVSVDPQVKMLHIVSNEIIDRVALYFINGTRLLQKKSGKNAETIDLNGLVSGIYIVMTYHDYTDLPVISKIIRP